MWIRSQDGTVLLDAVLIQAVDPRLGNGERRDIQAYMAHGLGKSMGQYDTEAEALRVLDRLQRQHDMDVYEHGPEGMRVFQMPEKGFEGKE